MAAISGVIMAVCALKGYELLGGKLTKKGVIISGVIMIVMTYVGDRVDWAIMIARELETDVFYGYRLLPLLLSEEVIDMTQLRAGTGTAICPSAGGSYPDYPERHAQRQGGRNHL